MVGFVQDEQGAGAELSKHIAQSGGVDLVGQQPVRDDETGAGRPGVNGKTPKPPYLPYPLPVDDLERETEFRFELILPLRSSSTAGPQ